ncbi:hypothetical protein AAFF_G00126230 [Aldrovandia affinis]|uniref:Apolipoprotein C-I n=1 Tax=Aldrovandia affinis TaxID=143900 RepID=A0AAD7RRG0_9TELE|nr:hypothetical protein AAFF_G00126230 [Aldrovandia affinis]
MADTISSLIPGDPIIINIDTVGCVFSPLVFILYTDDCRILNPNHHLVKFVDNTVLLSLLSGSAQDHGPALREFVEWKTGHTVKMKLPIAIAVLFLVLAANTGAEEAQAEGEEPQAEPTLEERFTNFGIQIKTFADGLKDKTKATFEEIHQSDFAIKTRNWFTDQFQKMKEKVDETFKTQ